ncbi:hypothetical protein LTR78_000169 [Recurvomyces mirabilis]|uniref:Cytochrome P450 n=1 Tax=Recurvomyces mirabilis TaxID=574656 RepID=A0AAE0WXJ4_9PEZI|nr:hypothetical protein LTR78_000169 [Recurvomyces mirabilis]KAK5161826.1 hypothetical protein LTS14_000171 [Recurvomyces mirabilis]
MSPLLILLALLLLPAILLLTTYLLTPRLQQNEPPHLPSSFSLIGHLLAFFRHGANYLTDLDTRHNSPGIYTLPLLPWTNKTNLYIINSASWAVAMQKHHRQTLSFNIFASQAMSLLFGLDETSMTIVKNDPDAEGNILVDQHDLLFSAFTDPSIEEINTSFLTAFTAHINILATADKASEKINLWHWLRTHFSLASTTAIFGPANPLTINPSLAEDVWIVDDSLDKLLTTPFPKFLLPEFWQARQRLWEAFESYTVQHHDEQGSRIVQLYIQSAKDHGLSTAMAGRQSLGLLFAALINTGPVAFWTLSYILSDPTLLSDIRVEVERCITTDPSTNTHTLSISALRAKAPLLWSCMRETMRIAATMNINRYITQDTEIVNHTTGESFVLRKGGVVTVAANVLHFRPEIWGQDVAEFRPRRFLSQHGGGVKVDGVAGGEFEGKGKVLHDPAATFRDGNGKLHPGAFRTFGGGNNICPGRHLAANEILAIIGLFVAGFEVSMVDGSPYVGPPYEKMKVIAGVHKPAHDVEVCVRRREGCEGCLIIHTQTLCSSPESMCNIQYKPSISILGHNDKLPLLLLLSKIRRLHIPRHTRQPHHQPIQLLPHGDLTPQATRLRQSKGKIQHVILIITGFLHLVVHLLPFHNNMAGRAGAGAATGAFHFQVVGLGYVEEVVAVCYGEGGGTQVLVYEGYAAFVSWRWGNEVVV